MITFIVIVIMIVLLDFNYTGFLPVLLKQSHPLSGIKEGVVFRGGVGITECPSGVNKKSSRVTYAFGIKLILTNDFLYIQNTLRSYANKYSVNEFTEFSIIDKGLVGNIFGNEIAISNMAGEKLRFRTEEAALWKDVLIKGGIPLSLNKNKGKK